MLNKQKIQSLYSSNRAQLIMEKTAYDSFKKAKWDYKRSSIPEHKSYQARIADEPTSSFILTQERIKSFKVKSNSKADTNKNIDSILNIETGKRNMQKLTEVI